MFSDNFLVVCATAVFLAQLQPLGASEHDHTALRVMSFNIRYGTAQDGENDWQHRKALVATTISDFSADLVGIQEAFDFQARFLSVQLPKFAYYGRARTASGENGEACGIFYRRQRFEKLGSGTFWFGPTPDVAGSIGWDASLPRIVSWIKLGDRRAEGRAIYVLNTHFDHRGKVARRESARQLRRYVARLTDGDAVIVMGDFNAIEGSRPYQALVEDQDVSDVRLLDAYRQAHAEPLTEEGTFHGFRGRRDGGRIDWILHTPGLKTVQADIDRTSWKGRYASDHFAVTAVLDYVRQ